MSEEKSNPKGLIDLPSVYEVSVGFQTNYLHVLNDIKRIANMVSSTFGKPFNLPVLTNEEVDQEAKNRAKYLYRR